ncbi:MAG: hypothetical protein WA951_06300, partial [Leeuwenhoekiella sp.]
MFDILINKFFNTKQHRDLHFAARFFWSLCFGIISFSAESQLSINTNFPGGNVLVDNVVGDTVYFKPDLRDTHGEWFYWNFEAVTKVQKRWYFKAEKKDVLTSLGAAASVDRGKSWNWINKRNN